MGGACSRGGGSASEPPSVLEPADMICYINLARVRALRPKKDGIDPSILQDGVLYCTVQALSLLHGDRGVRVLGRACSRRGRWQGDGSLLFQEGILVLIKGVRDVHDLQIQISLHSQEQAIPLRKGKITLIGRCVVPPPFPRETQPWAAFRTTGEGTHSGEVMASYTTRVLKSSTPLPSAEQFVAAQSSVGMGEASSVSATGTVNGDTAVDSVYTGLGYAHSKRQAVVPDTDNVVQTKKSTKNKAIEFTEESLDITCHQRSLAYFELVHSCHELDIDTLRHFALDGLPNTTRADVWLLLSGLDVWDGVTAFRYDNLVADVQENPKALSEEAQKAITLDIPRTFPGHLWLTTTEGQESLGRLLKCYARIRPNTGYVSAFNSIAGATLSLGDDIRAFALFTFLVESQFPEYYSQGMPGLHADLATIDELMESELPVVAQHLKQHNVMLSSIAPTWLLTLFLEPFHEEVSYRVWDRIFATDNTVPIRMTLCIMEYIQIEVIRRKSFPAIYKYIKGFADNMLDIQPLLQSRFWNHMHYPSEPMQQTRVRHLIKHKPGLQEGEVALRRERDVLQLEGFASPMRQPASSGSQGEETRDMRDIDGAGFATPSAVQARVGREGDSDTRPQAIGFSPQVGEKAGPLPVPADVFNVLTPATPTTIYPGAMPALHPISDLSSTLESSQWTAMDSTIEASMQPSQTALDLHG